MAVDTRSVAYEAGGTAFEAALALPEHTGPVPEPPLPTVLVLHGMEGRSDLQTAFAEDVARWGYAALAVDLFGVEASEAGPARCGDLTHGFLGDRAALHERLRAVVEAVTARPEVDTGRVVAMGFCFGGLCVLDLARIGAPVRGVASFHGVLTAPGTNVGDRISSRVLVLHGWDDPFAPPSDVTALGRELTDAGADWELHAYGNTRHAFMAPHANDPEAGVAYHPESARKARAAFRGFVTEVLGPGRSTEAGRSPGGGPRTERRDLSAD